MIRRASRFRPKIALLTAALSGIVLLSFGMTAWLWLNHERLQAVDRELRALAYRHPGWMNQRASYERLASAIEFIFGDEPGQRLVLLATDAESQVRFQSAGWPKSIVASHLDLDLAEDPEISPASPHALFTRIPHYQTVEAEGVAWRFAILGNENGRLVVGLELTAMRTELGRLRTVFVVALPIALLIVGAGGWLLAGHALRPVRTLASTIEQIEAKGLDRRIQVAGEDPDLDHLIRVLNGMLDRLDSSFRQATRFSADASHELKTPLAIMQAEVEQALHRAPPGSSEQQTHASLLEEIHRLKSTARSLLLLAQADSGRLPLSPQSLDLAAEVRALAEDAAVLAEPSGIVLSLTAPGTLTLHADRPLLRLALSNVLENAIHHNHPAGFVRLELVPAHGGATLRVENS
ncbi:MAG: HAMP domain-containing protein, partial [Verrucomicrobiales bacterium]|nr:HAMP domain-containing protein [Verrucomicrobiales bacterium]